jgi:hypothetical protein
MMRIKPILALAPMIAVMVSIAPSTAFAQEGTGDVLVSVDVAPVDVVAEPRAVIDPDALCPSRGAVCPEEGEVVDPFGATCYQGVVNFKVGRGPCETVITLPRDPDITDIPIEDLL